MNGTPFDKALLSLVEGLRTGFDRALLSNVEGLRANGSGIYSALMFASLTIFA